MFEDVLRASDVAYISKDVGDPCAEVDEIAVDWN